MEKYKSLLFVPAKEKMISKIQNFGADAFILDLEDSIEAEKKEEALETLSIFLHKNILPDKCFVRLNKEHIREELEILHQFPHIGFMLPKFETLDWFADDIVEKLKVHDIIALVETPKGVANIELIVSCPWIEGIAFGGEDYSAITNMENSLETLYYVKSRLVMYAKAYEKQVYDTPSFVIDNTELLEQDVRNAVKMGFNGKMAINPKQLDIIHRVFNECDLNEMKRVVQIYEETGRAVLKIDNKVYEKMHINRMKRILRENGV